MTLYAECEAAVWQGMALRPAPQRSVSLDILASSTEYRDRLVARGAGGPLGAALEPILTKYFSAVDEIFEDLKGDPVAVAEGAKAYDKSAADTAAKADGVISAREESRPVWTGDAAEAFRQTLTELAALDIATSKALTALADDQIAAAATLARTKAEMTVVAGELQLATISLMSQLHSVVAEMVARAAVEHVLNPRETLDQFKENMLFEFAHVLERYYRPVFVHLTALEHTVCAEAGRIMGLMAGLGNLLEEVAGWIVAKKVTRVGSGSTGFARAEGGTSPRRGDMDVISMMNAAGSSTDPPAGYLEVTDSAGLAKIGLGPDQLNQANGMQVKVYTDGAGKYVVVFPGTDFGDPRDVEEDFQGGGGVPAQTRAAIDVADRIARSGHAGDVVYAGHSLGGRLASVAAMATGGTAVTYNPAGVDDATVEYVAAQRGTTVEQVRAEAAADQRAYMYGGEILDRIQTKDPVTREAMPDNPGHRIDIPSPSAATQTGVDRHTNYSDFQKDLKAAHPEVFR